MSGVAGNWMGVAQYNRDKGIPTTVNTLCSIMQNFSSNPLAGQVAVWNLMNPSGGCTDISYDDMVQYLQNTSAANDARTWIYQTCMEFAYFQTTDSPSSVQPFGNLIPLSFYVDLCNDVYGIPFDADRIAYTNSMYGGRNLPATGPSNIIFVNGGNDPWHALGVLNDVNPSTPAIVIPNSAHCANDEYTTPEDLPSVIAARIVIGDLIGTYLTL